MINKEALFSKMLLEHGKFHASKNSIIDRAIALTHFHQAIELIIKFVIKDKKLQINDFELEKILNKLDPSTTTYSLKLPYWRDIFNLNRLRNNIYHDGFVYVPDEKTVLVYSEISENFFRQLLNQECNIDYDSLSLIDLISDQQIKERLETSQKLKDTSLKEAVSSVDQALYFVITKVLAKLGVYDLTAGGGFVITRSDGVKINRDVALSQALLFGEDYNKMARVQYISQKETNPSLDNYFEVFNYVIEIAHKSEEKYAPFPSVKAPW